MLGSPSPSVPHPAASGLEAVREPLTVLGFAQDSLTHPEQWTADHPTRLVRGSLCVPEPSPKMYEHQCAIPNLTPEPQLRALHKVQDRGTTPLSQKHSNVSLAWGGFVKEMLCLVKDLTCVGHGIAKLDDACPRPLSRISGRAATPPALHNLVAPASSTML